MGLALQRSGLSPRANVAQAKSPARQTLKQRFAKGEVEWSPDLQRVLNLPRREKPDLGPIIQGLTQVLRAPGGTQTLREAQAWSFFEAPMANGLFASIVTGGGKTLIGMLMAMVWPWVKENGVLRPPRAVLMIPPDLRVQFAADWERYSQHWVLPNLAGGKNFKPGKPTLHVIAYSELQQPKNSALLDQLRPDLFMGDEISALRNFEAARTIRVRRHFGQFSDTAFCGWDATLTSDSMQDYWHFLAWAFGENSPVPVEESEVRKWARAIDPVRFEDGYWLPGKLELLCKPGESVRSGLRRRLIDTLGVVTTEDQVLDLPLIFRLRAAPPMSAQIVENLKKLRRPPNMGGWLRPDGEVFTQAPQVVACARQLAEGFFLRWRYPRGEPRELIDTWFNIRQAWNRELRAQLLSPLVHMDSPKLCENAAERWYAGGCPGCTRGPQQEHAEACKAKGTHPLWNSWCYPAWHEIEDKVYHEQEVVWLSDFLLNDAARWAAESPGIVWVDHPEFGERLARLTGLTYYGGGEAAAEELEALYGEGCGRSRQSIICSVKANMKGKNLQYAFSRNLITSFPPSNAIVEQTVGRTFRPGQSADSVTVDYYLHTVELENAFELADVRAAYVWETFGTSQKLIFGRHE